MRSLRRWLAILLIVVLPLPAWATTGHCADLAATPAAHADQARHDHLTDHPTDHTGAHSVPAEDTDSSPEHAGNEHGGNGHASPCCTAVLPAPTCGQGHAMASATVIPAPASGFTSADPALLRRPPRHSRT